jgi:hypothetical protein
MTAIIIKSGKIDNKTVDKHYQSDNSCNSERRMGYFLLVLQVFCSLFHGMIHENINIKYFSEEC